MSRDTRIAPAAGPTPSALVAQVTPYPTAARAGVDLRLDGNEGLLPAPALLDALYDAGPEVLRSYPDASGLERRIAERHGLDPACVVVTAGADEALDRLCRAFLGPGRECVLPVPTFEMLHRYPLLSGGILVEVPWPPGTPWPTAAVRRALTPRTGIVALVSPNNPTGTTLDAATLRAISAAAPTALVLLDHAYAEFADEDLTPQALALPNAVVVRTLSKAYGLAGARVGYVLGARTLLEPLRAAAGPYPVAGPSLLLAAAALRRDAAVRGFVARVRAERAALADLLRALGAQPLPSQANFVLARFADPDWVRDALAGLGIAVRRVAGRAALHEHLRITCPGDGSAFTRLAHALRTALQPEALLLDLDGVLADVSRSYRAAIIATAASFGVALDAAEVAAAKRRGDANDDWRLTRRLMAERGVAVPQATVTGRFEALYQGSAAHPGLRATERLIPGRTLLERLALRLPLGIVTGRPRADAERFLDEQGIRDLFAACVTMEDAPAKPDPAPVRLALQRLGVARAWLVGDTVDDLRAARAADVVPLAVPAPGEDQDVARAAFAAAGVARTFASLAEVLEVLP